MRISMAALSLLQDSRPYTLARIQEAQVAPLPIKLEMSWYSSLLQVTHTDTSPCIPAVSGYLMPCKATWRQTKLTIKEAASLFIARSYCWLGEETAEMRQPFEVICS